MSLHAPALHIRGVCVRRCGWVGYWVAAAMSPHAPALFTARRAVFPGGWVGRNRGRHGREWGLGT